MRKQAAELSGTPAVLSSGPCRHQCQRHERLTQSCWQQEKGHKALGQQAAVSHLAQLAAIMGLGVWWLLEPTHHGPAQVCDMI